MSKGELTRSEMLKARGSIKSYQPGCVGLEEPVTQESAGQFHIQQVTGGGAVVFLSLHELEQINEALQANVGSHLQAGIQAAIFATKYGF